MSSREYLDRVVFQVGPGWRRVFAVSESLYVCVFG